MMGWRRWRLAAVVLIVWAGVAGKAFAYPPHEFHEVPHAKGYVIVIHAGGWYLVGRGMLGLEYPNVERLNRWGYSTLNVDYHKGAAALKDILGFHDRLRRRVGNAKICALGSSAGAHLALMLAYRRADVACVISEAAPTYLPGLHEPLLGYARRFFADHGGLRAWSPALHPPSAPILLAQAKNDTAVPFRQSTRMLEAAPVAKRIALRPGDRDWVHAKVRGEDLKRFYKAERKLLDTRPQSASPGANGVAR